MSQKFSRKSRTFYSDDHDFLSALMPNCWLGCDVPAEQFEKKHCKLRSHPLFIFGNSARSFRYFDKSLQQGSQKAILHVGRITVSKNIVFLKVYIFHLSGTQRKNLPFWQKFFGRVEKVAIPRVQRNIWRRKNSLLKSLCFSHSIEKFRPFGKNLSISRLKLNSTVQKKFVRENIFSKNYSFWAFLVFGY